MNNDKNDSNNKSIFFLIAEIAILFKNVWL